MVLRVASARPVYAEQLRVSPFLTDEGFSTVSDYAKGPLTVVSRQESLDGLSKENAGWISDAYVLSPTAGIPADEDDSTGGPVLSGLHAKMYVVERAKWAHLFLGSLNATRNGFNGNAEILVELTGSAGVFAVDAFLGKDGFTSILQPTTIEPAGQKADDPQGSSRRSSATSCRASSAIRTQDTYQLPVTSGEPVPIKSGVDLSISLLTDKSTATPVSANSAVDLTFEGLALSDVTAFIVLTVTDDGGRSSSAIVKCELINDIPGRMSSIITREIDSPDAFRRFLALLLPFGAPVEPGPEDDGDSEGGAGRWDALENGLSEQLLRAATLSPETLEQLAGVVTSIIENDDPHGVLLEGFRDMWSAIAAVTNLKVSASV